MSSLNAPKPGNLQQNLQDHQILIGDHAGFEQIAVLLKEFTGIFLPNNDKNRTLVAGRLFNLLQNHNLKNYKELATKLKSLNKELKEDFISCLTTNTTHFFRESAHYTVLKEYLQTRLADRHFAASPFRVWCSASSTGQEPYSILFTLLSNGFPLDKQKLEMLATDIDLDVLKKASGGVYTGEECKTIPPDMKQIYFQPQIQSGVTSYKIHNQYRSLINFARFNLIQDQPNFKSKFDVIFCRNVLIYFEKDVSTAVIDMLISQLKPGGLLFLGHVETGLLKNKSVTNVSHAVYKKI